MQGQVNPTSFLILVVDQILHKQGYSYFLLQRKCSMPKYGKSCCRTSYPVDRSSKPKKPNGQKKSRNLEIWIPFLTEMMDKNLPVGTLNIFSTFIQHAFLPATKEYSVFIRKASFIKVIFSTTGKGVIYLCQQPWQCLYFLLFIAFLNISMSYSL